MFYQNVHVSFSGFSCLLLSGDYAYYVIETRFEV